MTNLRATASIAFLDPIVLAFFNPQVLSALFFLDRNSNTTAHSKRRVLRVLSPFFDIEPCLSDWPDEYCVAVSSK